MSIVQGLGSGESGAFYPLTINHSLRFNFGDGAFLSRTTGSATNTYTFSTWVKRGDIGNSNTIYFFSSGNPGLGFIRGGLSSADKLFYYNGSTTVVTSRLFRDMSSWFHIVFSVNSGTGVIYLNGSSILTGISGASLSTGTHQTRVSRSSGFFDGYLAETHLVTGSALTPSSFGETKNDIWVAKNYTGSHGDDGFKLTYADSSSLGDDTSGENHDLTVTNLDATDQMLDSPTNNFAVMDALSLSTSGATLDEGNLKWSIGGADGVGKSNFVMTSGKWYCEVGVGGDVSDYIGVASGNATLFDVNGTSTVLYNGSDGSLEVDGTTVPGFGSTFDSSKIICMALDLDSSPQTIEFFLATAGSSRVSQGSRNLTDVGTEGYAFACGSGTGSRNSLFNFGQDSSGIASAETDENGIGTFEYAPPSGFLALCTANFPDPATDPAKSDPPSNYFNTVLYAGNGSTQNITGVGFQPDWSWIKNRTSSTSDSHVWTDSVRGVTKEIQSNNQSAQTTNADGLTAFGADGFSLGDDDLYNTNTETYVSWSWKAGTSFSNDASATSIGTIDSTGTVSTKSGFSIISYTGDSTGTDGTNSTVAHGLSSAPEWIIFKPLDTCDGAVYHKKATSASNRLLLFSASATSAESSDNTFFQGADPTNQVFSIGAKKNVNSNGGMIAYCFHSVEGFSKFGSYEGLGSTDGPFIFTGFRPAWIMIKNLDSSGNWGIWDTKRNTENVSFNILRAGESDSENNTQPNNNIDTLSNGFKVRGNTGLSGNAETYVYMAFAEQPLKYANAR